MPNVVTIESSVFIARFPVKSDKRAEFLAVFDALWRGSLDFLNEQCNFAYYGWDRTDRWFYTIESYKNEDVLTTLRQSEVFESTVRTLLGMCDANMELRLLRGMESDKSVFDRYPVGPSQVHPKAGAIGVIIT
jgi:quinol monooxygenase YgiN